MHALKELIAVLRIAWERTPRTWGGGRFWAFVQEAQTELNNRLPVATEGNCGPLTHDSCLRSRTR